MKDEAAAIQEDFDCLVPDLPWPEHSGVERPTNDRVKELVRKPGGRKTQRGLTDWYGEDDIPVEATAARLHCQTANCRLPSERCASVLGYPNDPTIPRTCDTPARQLVERRQSSSFRQDSFLPLVQLGQTETPTMTDEPERREFGKLEDVDPREAWKHEAKDFTPWLARNLGRLSEAIGVQLELETTEASVGQFAGDVLATGPDGQSVLIENQLEWSDHTHLGQVMTYLAGLDARIVVWVARGFTDPHVSAIQWLNRHTEAEFAFFAVRLRVVSIADSPLAPVFEVVAKPNTWERRVRREKTEGRAELVKTYREFWTHYSRRYPRDGVRANHGLANFWIKPRRDAPAISMAFAYAAGVVVMFFNAARTPGGGDEGVDRRAPGSNHGNPG